MPKKMFPTGILAKGLRYSTMYSGLDIEDNDPINVPKYNHKQEYTGKLGDTYKDEKGGMLARSPISNFGINDDEIQHNNIFKKTNLDLERTEPLGGPINTKSTRHAEGFVHKYTPTNPFIDPGTPDE